MAAKITKKRWMTNMGFYEFDNGYQGYVTVCSEEHKKLFNNHLYVRAEILVPGALWDEVKKRLKLKPKKNGSTGNQYVIWDENIVKDCKEGRKKGEEYLMKILSDIEAGTLTEETQIIERGKSLADKVGDKK